MRKGQTLDPSPPLSLKQQQFVLLVAAGLTQRDAPERAGYRVPEKGGLTLARNPRIRAAIEAERASIRERVAYGVDAAMTELDRIIVAAPSQKQLMAAVRAVETKAKLKGLLVVKVEISSGINLAKAIADARARLGLPPPRELVDVTPAPVAIAPAPINIFEE